MERPLIIYDGARFFWQFVLLFFYRKGKSISLTKNEITQVEFEEPRKTVRRQKKRDVSMVSSKGSNAIVILCWHQTSFF